MDKLFLDIKANDEIQPDLRELIDAMNKLNILPSNFDGKTKIQKWFTLNLSLLTVIRVNITSNNVRFNRIDQNNVHIGPNTNRLIF